MFFLYDVNKEIDIQFCLNIFNHVISFSSMRMNVISLLQHIHSMNIVNIVLKKKPHGIY